MSGATTFERGPAKTNGGFRVTILTTTARGPYPIVGLIHSKNEQVDDPIPGQPEGGITPRKRVLQWISFRRLAIVLNEESRVRRN